MKKKILVIATGGTIASQKSTEGLKPQTDVDELISFVPEAKELCELDMIQLLELDSTNLRPEDWISIAGCIRDNYSKYDGFLILHGTDTMSYTAAALSYLIQNSRKPIVITGSQKPIQELGSDAKDNVYHALAYATHPDAFGVNVVFDEKIIAGGRARKVKSHSFDAFDSVGYPPRGIICNDEIVMSEKMSCTEEVQITDPMRFETAVMDIKITPGLNPKILLQLAPLCKGFLLEGFGLGGLPNLEQCGYQEVIEELTNQGKIVVVTTQVPEEGTDMSVYEVGRTYLEELPILEGKTITPEAAVVKLMWILGQVQDVESVKNRTLIKKLFYQSIENDIV